MAGEGRVVRGRGRGIYCSWLVEEGHLVRGVGHTHRHLLFGLGAADEDQGNQGTREGQRKKKKDETWVKEGRQRERGVAIWICGGSEDMR